ncbi:MAG: M23 family metallopeptidase [Oscillospiraceae bacterium]|nr:M23 family metallopeptidase [Oscillospiraceae bacterium]
MKYIKRKQIGLSALALTASLVLSCNSFGLAEGLDGGNDDSKIVARSSVTEDEPNDSISKATDLSGLTYQDAVRGFISSSNDVDFYKFKTSSSQSGKIKLILNNPSDNYDYSVMIYKGSTSNVCGKVETAGNKTIMFSVSPNTTYYIKIYSANSKYTAITPYIFTLQHYSASENIYGSLGWAYPLPSDHTNITTKQNLVGTVGYSSNLKVHSGIDLPAHENDSIYNTADGVVIRSSYSSSMGNYVTVKTNCYEPNAYCSSGSLTVRYLHMYQRPNVSVNQKVSRGMVLGYVGNTGESYGDHLHIDINSVEQTEGPIMRNTYPTYVINPTLFYPKVKFTGMVSAEDEVYEEYLFENDFYSIDTVISDQVDQDEYDRFIKMYSGTADFNIVNFVKYFDYPKELFASIVDEYDLEWYDADVIYSDNEALIAEFFGLEN